jgi:hypothetical protein
LKRSIEIMRVVGEREQPVAANRHAAIESDGGIPVSPVVRGRESLSATSGIERVDFIRVRDGLTPPTTTGVFSTCDVARNTHFGARRWMFVLSICMSVV